MGGLTTEEFKSLLEEALEPLRRSIDEVKKSIATTNSNYYQVLIKYLELLSAIFTLLNVHPRDEQGHMIKIEAFTADDSRSCN